MPLYFGSFQASRIFSRQRSRSRRYISKKSSSQAELVNWYPACSRPCRTDTVSRALTSPEPVPPLTVISAPAPYSAILLPLGMGRMFPLFFSSTMPSAAAILARRRCSLSRGLTSFVREPVWSWVLSFIKSPHFAVASSLCELAFIALQAVVFLYGYRNPAVQAVYPDR